MPKKKNKAGQDQEYVPSGNGDASGEYADDGGSNRHFVSFKKPEDEVIENKSEENKQTFKKFEKVGKENEIEYHKKNATQSLIKKCVNKPNEENDKTFKEVIEDCNDDAVKILDNYLVENERLKIRFGNAGRNAAGSAWGDSDIITNRSVHTIRHEIGHTYDKFYGKTMGDNGRNSFEANEYASVRYVDKETGKTMNETIHEELGVSMYKATIKGWKIGYVKQGVDKRETRIAAATHINDVFNKYADKIFDEYTGIKNARLRYKELRIKYNKLNEFNSSFNQELANTPEKIEYDKLRSEVYKAENEYSDRMFKSGATSVTFSNSAEVNLARQKADKAFEKYRAKKDELFKKSFGEGDYAEYEKLSKSQWEVYKKIEGVAGLVGDTFDYIRAGSSFYQTNGHGNSYFNQRKESGYVLEIFANMFDCYTSKDSWKKECVKEMFPKTSQIFEKIYYNKGV